MHSKEISITTKNHASEKYWVIQKCIMTRCVLGSAQRWLLSVFLPTMWTTIPWDVESVPLPHQVWPRSVTALSNGMWRELWSSTQPRYWEGLLPYLYLGALSHMYKIQVTLLARDATWRGPEKKLKHWLLSHVQLLVTWTVARQVLLSREVSRQEY